MKTTWVLDVFKHEGRFVSPSASARYRGLIPAEALSGAIIPLADVYEGRAALDCDALVIGKLMPTADLADFARQTESMLALARTAKARGITVGVDVSDNHFAHPKLGDYWRALVPLADVCVVGSEPLAEIARQHTGARIAVIGDPLGSPAGVPRVYSGGTARLVWYGHLLNFGGMADWAKRLKGDIAFTVVTSESPQLTQFAQAFNKMGGPQMKTVEWSEDAQWAAVESADAVLIPSDKGDPRKNVKTANRLTDAINAGRWVIASPLPSYQEFGAYCDLTDDPAASLARYLANPSDALERIERGQVAVREACGAIAQKWLAALS